MLLLHSRTDAERASILLWPNLHTRARSSCLEEDSPMQLLPAWRMSLHHLPSIWQCLQRYSTPYGTSLLYSPALLRLSTWGQKHDEGPPSSIIGFPWSRNHRKVFRLLLLLFLRSSAFTDGRIEARWSAAIFYTIQENMRESEHRKFYNRPSDYAKTGRLDCNKALIQTQSSNSWDLVNSTTAVILKIQQTLTS
jgi:hypothetical protein